jgi:hypothetical protein
MNLACADALAAIIRVAMAVRGLEWAAGFSWEQTAIQTAAVYRELL